MTRATGTATPLGLNRLQVSPQLVALADEGISIPYNLADDGKILLIVNNSADPNPETTTPPDSGGTETGGGEGGEDTENPGGTENPPAPAPAAPPAPSAVTVHSGNGLQGVADYTVDIPAGETWYGVFESGAFMNVSGADKGNLILTGPANLLAGAICLPD